MTNNQSSPPDWRGLCSRMADELDHYRQLLADDRREVHPLAVEARLALAQPEPEVVGPTDEEVEAWADQQGFIRGHGDHPCGFWIDDGDAGAFVRAALVRWGRPAPAPVEAEVGELVEFLRIYGDEVMDEYGDVGEHDQLTRAADLLEQRHPAPVPVSEWLRAEADRAVRGDQTTRQEH